MSLDLKSLPVADQIKIIANFRGFKINQLCNEFNRRFGTKYSAQSFRNKLNNGALSFDDVEKFGQILNFSVEIKVND